MAAFFGMTILVVIAQTCCILSLEKKKFIIFIQRSNPSNSSNDPTALGPATILLHRDNIFYKK